MSACSSSGPDAGSWEHLPGIFGEQIWSLSFDAKSRPLVGGFGGLRRYSDADGWLEVGHLTSDRQVYATFPAADGGVFVSTFAAIYKLDVDATTWTSFAEWSAEVDTNKVVTFVGGDGTIYRQRVEGGYEERAPASTAWEPLPGGESPPSLTDAQGNAYSFASQASITRRDAGKTDVATIVDCHTKDLLQCGLDLVPMRIANGKLYFAGASAFELINRVYSVPTSGGTPTLLADLPPNDYVYNKSDWVTDDETAYITAAPSTDAYGYGDTWRFEPGDTGGAFLFKAPDANIAVAPDGTVYSYLPVNGDVERWHP